MWDPSRSNRIGLVEEFLEPQVGEEEQTPEGFTHTSSLDLSKPQEFEKYMYGHHINRASFLRAIDEGCAMCNRISPLVDDLETYEKIEKSGYFSVFSVLLKEGKLIMFIYYGIRHGGFYFVPFGEQKYDSNLNFELGPTTNDPTTWSMIRNWFTTCLESHDCCPKPSISSSYMPNRILAVDHSKPVKTFQLVEGSACPQSSQYVTLSHCWGKMTESQGLRLLTSTFNEISHEQPLERLPKTFIDAVNVAERLGIHYIWIDKLCIRQDSAEDWRREASVMQDVYKNALFNISALGAENDSGGCFFSRDVSKVVPTVVRLKFEDGDPRPFRFELEKGWAWCLSFNREPLLQRAWVVQERLLSPRILHFGRAQVYWECSEVKCCETHPNGVHLFDDVVEETTLTSQQQKPQRTSHLCKPLLPGQTPATDPYEQLFLDWNGIVELYANCKLTVASDKLVALSGLANHMKRRLQELRPGTHRYLAGIWEQKLHESIAWNVRSPAQRASEYRAPSWSWACLNGHLHIRLIPIWEENVFSCARFISAEIQHFNEEDDTGEVKSGTLTLTGPWAIVHTGPPISHLRANERQISSSIDPADGINNERNKHVHEGTKGRLPSACVTFDTLEDIESEVFHLIIRAFHWIEGNWMVEGLALALVDGDIYRRLGTVHYDFSSQDKAREFSERFSRKQVKII
ncbi:hypothetical protein MMC11_008775 [Xylographa trunciseda]|nr:hypothetical protein [Xylographa trunciseda]